MSETVELAVGTNVVDIGVARRALSVRHEVADLRRRLRALTMMGMQVGEVTNLSADRHVGHHDAHGECKDGGILIDEDCWVVKCEACGERLDPVEVLRQYAHEERAFVADLQHLRAERERLARDIEQLKRQRVYLRKKVRKDGGDPDAVVAEIYDPPTGPTCPRP